MYRHPSHLAKTSLFAVLLGVAIPLAIQNLAGFDPSGKPNFTPNLLIANVAFVLTALNFYHAKVVATEDGSYRRRLQSSPLYAALDFWLHAFLLLSFVAMAVCLADPRRIAYSNIAVRLVDAALIGVMMALTVDREVRRSLRFWLAFDAATALAFGAWLLTAAPPGAARGSWLLSALSGPGFVPRLFLAIVLLDLLIDYVLSKGFYFSHSSDWGEISCFWDASQGMYGDVYRRAIVNPALRSLLAGLVAPPSGGPGTPGPSGLSVLDLGCGNGCVARHLSSCGHRVLGVDKFEAMLDLARTYSTPGPGRVEYVRADMDLCSTVRGSAIEGPFDVVLACFSLQDCSDLGSALRLAAANIRPEGHLVIVYEDLAALEEGSAHLSARLWVGERRATRAGGAERAQMISWSDDYLRIAQDERTYYEYLSSNPSCELTVRTTVRDDLAYLGLASALGFTRVVGHPEVLRGDDQAAERADTSVVVRNYDARPRFGLLCLQYTGQLPSGGAG